QLHSGSVLYSPASDEITMQLTVTTPSGPVSESVMVVLSRAGPPKTYPLSSSPQSTPSKPPTALVVKASKPFDGNPVVISSSPETPPTLTAPPLVAVNPPEASARIPAVVAPQLQAPPPEQQQAPPPSPEPPATVATTLPQRPVAPSNYTPPKPIS